MSMAATALTCQHFCVDSCTSAVSYARFFVFVFAFAFASIVGLVPSRSWSSGSDILQVVLLLLYAKHLVIARGSIAISNSLRHSSSCRVLKLDFLANDPRSQSGSVVSKREVSLTTVDIDSTLVASTIVSEVLLQHRKQFLSIIHALLRLTGRKSCPGLQRARLPLGILLQQCHCKHVANSACQQGLVHFRMSFSLLWSVDCRHSRFVFRQHH